MTQRIPVWRKDQKLMRLRDLDTPSELNAIVDVVLNHKVPARPKRKKRKKAAK